MLYHIIEVDTIVSGFK